MASGLCTRTTYSEHLAPSPTPQLAPEPLCPVECTATTGCHQCVPWLLVCCLNSEFWLTPYPLLDRVRGGLLLAPTCLCCASRHQGMDEHPLPQSAWPPCRSSASTWSCRCGSPVRLGAFLLPSRSSFCLQLRRAHLLLGSPIQNGKAPFGLIERRADEIRESGFESKLFFFFYRAEVPF